MDSYIVKKKSVMNIRVSYATLCDLALLIYFCVMFAHQRENILDTVLRYGSFLLVVCIYVLIYPPIVRLRRQQTIWISTFEIWILVVFLYGAFSMFWSLDAGRSFNVLFNIGKTMVVCFLVYPHLNSRRAIEHVLLLLLLSLCYMALLLAIRTPFSAWGTERIGEVINQHSNEIGRLACLGALISAYFFTSQKKFRLLLLASAVIFTLCAFMTGSKNALFILLFQFGLYYFCVSGNWKKILVITGIIIAGILGYRLIITNEILYGLVGNRLERMLMLFTNGSTEDGSTLERLYFMQTAWMLFKKHPIIGIGMNNFSVYLASIGYGNAVYSHCGFLEILSTLGLIGFILYYFIYVKILKNLVKFTFQRDCLCALLFVVVLRIFVFDITTISLYIYNTYIVLLLAFCMYQCVRAEQLEAGKRA